MRFPTTIFQVENENLIVFREVTKSPYEGEKKNNWVNYVSWCLKLEILIP